ncbi:hypothetical protein QWY87_15360 [Lutimonas halocynthiae]|uniref:hypothetical protein n=1 Tax=Lutimonas halocynthiae TaxID=1446477 RepID=UPI0025B377B5|nr:hypothetical protein [Lutimonas halocynthiae]MDN3644092.1 hypothetical protein [Lutimonas halocynthiae]
MIKRLLFLLFIFTFSIGMSGQASQDELQLMQSLYGMEKRDIVSEFIELNDSQEQEFWLLYDEYEEKRKDLGTERFRLLTSYVDDYGEVKPQDADNFMKQAIPLRIKSDKLVDNYYKKIKSRTDPIVAMQFYQIENYLADVIRMELLEEIYTTKKQ